MSTTHHTTNRWIRCFAIAIFCISSLFASVSAEAKSPWSVELTVGQASFDADIDPEAGFRIDDKTPAAGIAVGYEINPYLSIQAGYRDLGDSPVDQPVCIFCELDERLILALDSESTGLSLAAVPRWPIDDRFSLYGKLGVFHWDADLNVAFSGERIDSFSEEKLLAAVGAHYKFTSGLGVLVEYEVVSDLFDGANLGLSWDF